MINDDGSERPDKEDNTLMDNGLGELLQVENASEAFKELTSLDTTCKLNYILNKVANNWFCDFGVIKSIGSNVLGDPDEVEEICKGKGEGEGYCQQMLDNYILKEIRDNLFISQSQNYVSEYKNSFDYIIHMVALTLEDGAHWAAIIYESETNSVHLYDSMQTQRKDNCSKSPYTWIFKKYSEYLFQTNKVMVQGCSRCPDIRPSGFHRQSTGGFVHQPFKKHEDGYYLRDANNKYIYKTITEYNEKELKQLQDFKSQHHFCYMEAILFIIEFLVFKTTGFKLNKPQPFNKLDMTKFSLSYIKRFIWVLVNKFQLFSPNQPSDFDCVYKADDGEYYYEEWIKRYTESGSEFPTQKAINFFYEVFPYAWDYETKSLIKLIDNKENVNNIKNCRDLLDYVYDTSLID